MTAPLLRCAPLATPRGRCHGINDEYLRRGAESGSPFSFLAQEFQTRAHVLRDDRIAAPARRFLEPGRLDACQEPESGTGLTTEATESTETRRPGISVVSVRSVVNLLFAAQEEIGH